MTTLILSEGDPFWTIPGGGSLVEIFGSSGVDSLAFSEGARATLDGSFNAGNDQLYIQGDSTEFQVSRSGASVTLWGSDGSEISIPAGATGQQIVFGNGALDLGISDGQVMIGNQTVTEANSNLSASVNSSITSGDYFNGTGGGSTGDYTVVSADVGTLDRSVYLDAFGDGFKFTDDATVQNNVVISNFADDDLIEVSGAEAGDYSFANDGADVDITFNFNDEGLINRITLIGVVGSSDIVYDEASFETAIGFDAITFA
jgi:hypothetical protein